MARIQQSIEINAPVHAAYARLTRFEDYPRFMQDIEAVHQLDDTHLHWSARMSDRNMEWDSEITEQQPDRCVAWRNLSGPQNTGKVELQPIGQDKASVTLTMECEPEQMLAAHDGNAEKAMVQRVAEDLVRLKKLIEKRDLQDDAHDAHPAGPQGLQKTRQQQDAQAARTTQSDASLSRTGADEDDQGRFRVAEEQNFDAQSDQARRVGQMPAADVPSDAAGALGKAMQQESAGTGSRSLDKAIDRTVPPSEEPGTGKSS